MSRTLDAAVRCEQPSMPGKHFQQINNIADRILSLLGRLPVRLSSSRRPREHQMVGTNFRVKRVLPALTPNLQERPLADVEANTLIWR